MIVLELNTTANQYISLNGEADQRYWKALIESMGSPQYRMDQDHGGFVDLTFGTLTLSLDVFSSDWPPPRQLTVIAKYTQDKSGSATAFRVSGVDGTAFFDQDDTDLGAIFAENLNKYIEIADSGGKKAGGWIKAQGSGETLSDEIG